MAGPEELEKYASEVPETARLLAEAFWPGPLTLLLPRRSLIPDLVTSGLPRAAFRVPGHPLALELLGRLDFPLAGPSPTHSFITFSNKGYEWLQNKLDTLQGDVLRAA